MKKWLFLLHLVIIMFLLVSCGGAQATTAEPTPEPTSTPPPQPTEASTSGGIEYQAVPLEEVQNVLWQWQSLFETDPAGQSIVAEPQKYSLVLNQDGSYSAVADCNSLSGTYTSDGSLLSLLPGATTLVECGPESLYDQYLQLLGNVTAFGISGGNLVLELANAAGVLTFSNAGPVSTQPERECDAGIDPATVTLDTQGLPYPYQPNCVFETPYDESQVPLTTGLPDHIQVNFGVSDPALVKAEDPIIYVIPKDAYTALWEGAGNPSITNDLLDLQEILLQKTDPFTGTVSILPKERETGTSDIQGQFLYLTAQNGPGIRFVTRFVEATVPLAGDQPQLFYVYQGLTFDGSKLVSFFYPVTTTKLPAAAEVTPDETSQAEADPVAYAQTKTAELNAILPSEFSPDLATLDKLIQSLRWGTTSQVGEPPPIANISWLWAEYNETEPASQTIIAEPYKYSVAFAPDGSLAITADCNKASGAYTYNGPQVTIQVQTVTQAACPEGSLSEQFLSLSAWH